MLYYLSTIRGLVLALMFVAAAIPQSSWYSFVNASDDNLPQYLKEIRQKYEELPDQGKFVTGAIIGYGGSKAVTRSAVAVVKIAGAAFVATELMQAMGVLDDLVSEEQMESGMNFGQKALGYVGEVRRSIKSKFDGDNIKQWLETDRAATLGAATGAVAGFLL